MTSWILPKQLHTLASALDTAALISDSEEQSQICAQSLFLRSKLSPARTWSLKWKRDTWIAHLSGRILKPSLGERFVTEWTSSLVVIPANLSQPQESDSAQKTPATSGHSSQMEFGFFDPASASLKMSRDTSVSDCEKSLESWNKWVTKCRGEYSVRVKLAHLTRENECLSLQWPTPIQGDSHLASTPEAAQRRIAEGKVTLSRLVESGRLAPVNPSTDGSRLESWATPECKNHVGYQVDRTGAMWPRLGSQVKAWATPRAGCLGSRAPGTGGKVLEEQVKGGNWATPRSRDAGDWMMNKERLAAGKPEDTLTGQATQSNKGSGKLNPRWVETLMGLPVGWVMPSCANPVTIAPTNCACSATESCQQPQP